MTPMAPSVRFHDHVQDQLALLGFEVWPSKTPVEFARYVEAQLAHWTDLIRRAGIKPE